MNFHPIVSSLVNLPKTFVMDLGEWETYNRLPYLLNYQWFIDFSHFEGFVS